MNTSPTVTVQAKAWWKSKLVWLGGAQIIIGLAEMIATTPVLEGSEVAGIAATVAGALTVALRFVTKRPVAASSDKLVDVLRAEK